MTARTGRRTRTRTRTRTRALALAAMLLALGGCANQATRTREALQALESALPGEYASGSEADAVGVTLVIRRLLAPAVGEAVFYVHAAAADDPRRVLWQRVWTLSIGEDKQIVQTQYVLKEPRRWRGALDEPMLLQALLPDDLTALGGCALQWQQVTAGFEAHLRTPPCRPGSEQRGLWVEQHIALESDTLELLEQQIAAVGPASTWTLRLHRDGAR